MKQFNMVVSKKVINPTTKEGEYQEVGKVAVPVFSLSEFGISSPQHLNDAERLAAITAAGIKAEDDEGLDYYNDPRVQYVYDAVVAATKADARNKLISGTANIKAGNKIADTVEELIAKAERSGAALALNREFLASFAAYLAAKSGKSAVVQALYNSMTKTRQSITMASQARKDGLLAQLTAYAVQCSTEDAAKYNNILTTLAELCESAEAISEDEVL